MNADSSANVRPSPAVGLVSHWQTSLLSYMLFYYYLLGRLIPYHPMEGTVNLKKMPVLISARLSVHPSICTYTKSFFSDLNEIWYAVPYGAYFISTLPVSDLLVSCGTVC